MKIAPPSSGHINSATPKIEAAHSCETSVNFYHSTRRHTHTHSPDNLKSHFYRFVVEWGPQTLSLFSPEETPLVSDTVVLCSILGIRIALMTAACIQSKQGTCGGQEEWLKRLRPEPEGLAAQPVNIFNVCSVSYQSGSSGESSDLCSRRTRFESHVGILTFFVVHVSPSRYIPGTPRELPFTSMPSYHSVV
jgi:hypothetical protein